MASSLRRLCRPSTSLDTCLRALRVSADGICGHIYGRTWLRRVSSSAHSLASNVKDSSGQPKEGSQGGEPSQSSEPPEQSQSTSVLQAHLQSLKAQEPEHEKAAEKESSEAGTQEDSSTGTLKTREMPVRNAKPVQRLIFDDDTAARVPGGDQKPARWDSRLEAQVEKAATELKLGDTAPSAPPKHPSGLKKKPVSETRKPMKIQDLPPELRPHFQQIVRKRPDPVRVTKVWELLRSNDKVGRAARASGFQPSIDCSISLQIDPRKSDQLVRGTVSLPHGTGQDTKIAVFTANSADADAAAAAGAAIVGGEDLVAKVAETKSISADAVIATPDMVPKLGKIARILGPRGLMPNPKFGTVTTSVAASVAELRRGKVQFRNDKGGTLSASIGRKSFADDQLTENFFVFLQAVMDLRPKRLSGSDITGYVERVSVSTTQGKGFPISIEDLAAVSRQQFFRSRK